MDKLVEFSKYLQSLAESIITCLIYLIKYSYNNPTEVCIIFIVIFFVIFIVGYLLYKGLVNIDKRIDYSNKKLKYSHEKDLQNNETYYVFNYWKWQKNKFSYLHSQYKIGTKLPNNHIITYVGIPKKRTNNIFSKKFYKKEFRVYTKFINPPSNYYRGDYIEGNKITNSGIQVNNIQNQFPKSVLEKILELASDNNIKKEDREEIAASLKKIEDKLYSQQDNKKLIDILNKYSGISANIITIIDFLSKL